MDVSRFLDERAYFRVSSTSGSAVFPVAPLVAGGKGGGGGLLRYDPSQVVGDAGGAPKYEPDAPPHESLDVKLAKMANSQPAHEPKQVRLASPAGAEAPRRRRRYARSPSSS